MDIRNTTQHGTLSAYMVAWGIALFVVVVGLSIIGSAFDDTIMSSVIMITGGLALLMFFLTVYAASFSADKFQARYGLPETLPETIPADVTALIQRLEAIGFEQGGIMTLGPLMLHRADGELFEGAFYEYVLFEPEHRTIAKITMRNKAPEWGVRFVTCWSDERVLITENHTTFGYDSGLVKYQTLSDDTEMEALFAAHQSEVERIQAGKGRPIRLYLIEDVVNMGNAKREHDTGPQIIARKEAIGCFVIQVLIYAGFVVGLLLFRNELEVVWQAIFSVE